MSMRYTLFIGDSVASAKETLEGEFSDAVGELLINFVTFADELHSTEAVRKGSVASMKVSLDELGMTISRSPETELDQLLMALRPFILNNEPTYLPKVANVLCREINDRRVRGVIGDIRARFLKGSGGDGPLRVMIIKGQETFDKFLSSQSPSDAVMLDSDDVLYCWLNGFKFHRNDEERRKLKDLCGGLSLDCARVGMLLNLSSKVDAISQLAALLRAFAQRVSKEREA